MTTLQELLASVAADLDPAIDYETRLRSNGYRTLNSIKQVGNAETLQRDCELLPGDARIIWQAAVGIAGHPQTIPVDKTARKVAQLAQLVQGPPPSFHELEAYLFRHPDVKLPVSDAKYYSLVAANEALMSKIEPASASGAEALAEVVTAALRMQYEPVEDETSLAGFVDMLLWHIWRCIDMYDQGPKLGMRRKRNCAADSATLKGKRPDFFLLSSRALLFKGEDKTSEAELGKALEELSTKLKDWGAAVHGKVEYLLCYACAGSQFQMCAMQLGTPGAFRFRRPLSLVTLEDRLQIVWIAVQSYWVMKAQAEQVPSVLLPVGHTNITTFSKVQIFDSFVQKRITFSDEAWPPNRCQLMEKIYAASKDCPFLIHAKQPPHASQNGKEYIVDLEPVGQPVLSKHFDQRPQSSGELKKSIRCILHALKVLHQAGYAHTDLRWENIILQHAGQWVLIDLEFACVLNSVPFTPTGHTRNVRSELYTQPWSRSCDLVLVGDLIEACHVQNLGDQGIELKDRMQAGQCNTAASVLEHPWLT
ncbi:hypothetical protein ABBQ38_006880 [Trebouxia sp. C0009 RCD-2024]